MILVMSTEATAGQVDEVLKRLQDLGLKAHAGEGMERTIIEAVGDTQRVDHQLLKILPGVEDVIQTGKPFSLAGRHSEGESTEISLGNLIIGSKEIIVMAGPCAVETREQTLAAADAVKNAGAKILRGGAFKPRTSPYTFRGLGRQGLEILREAKERTGLAIVTEVMAPQDVDMVSSYADILQVGARNMQNYPLLEAIGKSKKPVLLKRGMMCTVEDLLVSADYILSNGNRDVILCERGIRSFEKYTRNTLDISAVPAIKALSHLPVVVDPSHATGRSHLVAPMSKAAIAAGADGLMIEVHPDPARALSDGYESLSPVEFSELMIALKCVASAVGRTL